MERRIAIALLAAVLGGTLLASACATPPADATWLDPTAGAVTAAPTDWMHVGSPITPAPITPVAPEAMPAVRVALPSEAGFVLTAPLADGGLLAVVPESADASDPNASGRRFRAVRYDRTGKVLWNRADAIGTFYGYVLSIVAFPDGSFAAAVRETTEAGGAGTSRDRLVRFTKDGTWRGVGFDAVGTSGAFEFIVAKDDGTVFAAGTVQVFTGDTQSDSDLILTRIAPDGTATTSPGPSTAAFETLYSAGWASGTGLALAWSSQEAGNDAGWTSHVALYDDALALRWTEALPAGTTAHDVYVLADGKGVFVAESRIREDSDGSDSSATIGFLDAAGTMRWEYVSPRPRAWIRDPIRLADGRTLVAVSYASSDAWTETTEILPLSASGEAGEPVAVLPGFVSWMKGTKDGGATVVTRQEVAALPQPPYISSMWTDTRAVAAHLDATLRVAWERVVDQYKTALRSDVLVLSSADRLFVG